MIYASHILVQRKRLELWNGNLQSVNDSAQTCPTSPLRRFGDLLDEIAAIRIVGPPDRPVGFTHELRDDVRITHGAQEISHEPKCAVCIDLLEKGLAQPRDVVFVLGVRSAQPLLALLTDDLLLDVGTLLVVLRKADLVLPRTRILVRSKGDAKLHIWDTDGRQASAAQRRRFASRQRPRIRLPPPYVVQEPDSVQEIGLARGVRRNQKRASARSTSTLGKLRQLLRPRCVPRHRRAPWAFLRGQGGHAGHSARVRRAGGVREPIRARRPSTARRSVLLASGTPDPRQRSRGRHMPEEVLRRDLQRPHATAGPEPGRRDPSRRGTRSAPAGEHRHADAAAYASAPAPLAGAGVNGGATYDGLIALTALWSTTSSSSHATGEPTTYRALGVHQLLR